VAVSRRWRGVAGGHDSHFPDREIGGSTGLQASTDSRSARRSRHDPSLQFRLVESHSRLDILERRDWQAHWVTILLPTDPPLT